MIRLNIPKYTFSNTLDLCINGITGNKDLKLKMQVNQKDLLICETQYSKAASTGSLFEILPINSDKNNDPLVVNDLTKSELKKIYEGYFRSEEKPAREIYDHILNAADERCPYCGGIGTPRNLDHFLPVAHFPQFSVLPLNLVPACRDCNMDGVPDGYATQEKDQIIQPYMDNERFFSDQWIFATYKIGNVNLPGVFEYLATPPVNWPPIDKMRAIRHFLDFGLSRRYSTKAAELIGTTMLQINRLRKSGLNDQSICQVLLNPGISEAPFINHWQRGMFQALIDALPQIA